MPKNVSKTSVSSVVGALELDQSATFQNKPLSSVSVMVSQLKKSEAHNQKKFKIKQNGEANEITVTRIA